VAPTVDQLNAIAAAADDAPARDADPAAAFSAYDVGQVYLDVHVRLRRTVDAVMTATGISLSRSKVLKELAEHGPMNQAKLAGRLGFAPRSVTDAVEALERDGLALRADDPADRRARIVAITPAGADALDRALAAKYEAFDQIFGSLEPAERTQFIALLQTLGRSIPPSRTITSPPGDCFVE
jgi:DNA-binding MarR family transcriptional regulator